MLALAFTFPGGRYHATPWGRHVNEGAVAWPPEPWRILRSLIATWHHKIAPGGKHDAATLAALIETLAGSLPQYTLPAASHSHTRHYMPQFKAGDTSLVFDAFAAVGKEDALTVAWRDVDLTGEQTALLEDLLAAMGYLGRAESWVDARRIVDPPASNCSPGTQTLDTETGEVLGEIVTLMAALPRAEYEALRQRFLVDKAASKKLGATLPEGMLAALSIDTASLRRLGWNRPPASRDVSYLRPIDALRPVRKVHAAALPSATTVQFLVLGHPLPRVEDSLRIGEIFRAAVMSSAKRRMGEDRVPAVFSGHDLPDDNRHGHAFYLPWDSDGDGRIDRIVFHVPVGMDAAQRRTVESMRHLWSRDGGEWRLALEGVNGGSGCALLGASDEWRSVTPYLHPWHCKKGWTVEDQIRRECRHRGLPEPAQLERLSFIQAGQQVRRPIHFHRFRSRRGLTQPDRLGSFWRLVFDKPIRGPLAIGFGCHFGLGLFAPS